MKEAGLFGIAEDAYFDLVNPQGKISRPRRCSLPLAESGREHDGESYDERSENLLIQGDNLEVLKAL